jgi:hypothetical protein
MDNNSFENEFIQNVKQTTRPPAKPSIKPGAGESKLPLVIALVTSFIVLIESIILVTFTVNYFNKDQEDDDDENISVYDDSPESLSEEGAFTLDDSYAITAFNLTCTSEEGSKYVFKKSKAYQKSDATSTTIDSGNYAILNETAVILNSDNSSSDEESIVYYDGVYVIEGKTFYECKEDTSK